MKSLITLLALLSSQVFALDAFYLPYTNHLEECDYKCPYKNEFNEKNHVTGITNGKYSAFALKNSYNKYSVFIGRQLNYNLSKNINVISVIGGVTGYSEVRESIEGVTPAAYFGVDVHPDNSKWGVVFAFVPTSGGVLNAGFRLTL